MSFVDFSVGALNYRLTDEQVCYAGVTLPALKGDAATRVLRAALSGTLPIVATRIRAAFSGIDGGRAGAPRAPAAQLPDMLAQMVRQGRLSLYELGPEVILVRRIDTPPEMPPGGSQSLISKIGIVVYGIKDVPVNDIAEGGAAAFAAVVKAMTDMPALAATMVFVFVGWVASHATGVGGLVVDGVLLGIAVASIGMRAFGWFGQLGTLIKDIDAAKSDADLRRCSAKLANLFIEIGVTSFITLVTRAAGTKIGRTMAKDAPELKTGTGRPAPSNKSQSPEVQQYLSKSGGRLGGTATRRQNNDIASKLEDEGWTITGGAGRAKEQWIPGPGGSTKGGTFVDITATRGTETMRIQTVTTLADGVTPTAAETAAGIRIADKYVGDALKLIPKGPK